ncbi:MAG: response regulator [Myxococcales bacterium]|nr:response regulator [Myxococcales bacterium]
MTVDDELLEVFREEVGAQLDALSVILAQAPSRWDLDRAFHLAHNAKGAGRMVGAQAFAAVAHALEDVLGELRAGARATRSTVALARRGVALAHECFVRIGGEQSPDVEDYVERVGAALGRPPGVLEVVAEEPRDVAEEPRDVAEAPRAESTTVRISVDRLGVLMGLGAELMTGAERSDARRALAKRVTGDLGELRRQRPEVAREPRFVRALDGARTLLRELERDRTRSQQLSDRLQDGIRQLRMVRVDTLRFVLGRAIDAASMATGRSAMLEIDGGQTEIDRAILERLRDPLLHLVRNAVAHGLEPAEERRARGKAERGTIRLTARGEGAFVELEVGDDGRGVDVEAVRAKLVREGLASAEATAREPEQLFEALFRPGFSTVASVSELAGRGFGMDIVRTNLREVGGSVVLESEPGLGTRVRLRAPLTLLTTRVLMVSSGGQTFALPMIGVDLALFVSREDVRLVDGEEVVPVGDALVPLVPLAAVLGLDAVERGERRPAVVVVAGHHRRALWVDEVVGEREITIQARPWNLERVPCVASVALTESEEVVIVLDVDELATSVTRGASVATSREATAHQRRVLVVDDSITSRTLVKNILSSAGYEVATATDGEAALRLLRELEVDLVVSDVDMPKMTGIELTRAIRASPSLERLPVILVTSLGSEEDRQRGADAGADAYVVKGAFDQDELLTGVARLL